MTYLQLGPGKGPGFSFKHSSSGHIIQQQYPTEVPRRTDAPDELAARALEHDT